MEVRRAAHRKRLGLSKRLLSALWREAGTVLVVVIVVVIVLAILHGALGSGGSGGALSSGGTP